MWWLLTQHFGLRDRQEHHDMKVDDFQLYKDNNGVEFVQFTEGQTKTRQVGLHTKHRDFQPRMFAVGGERCPVALFKQFVSRWPQNLKTTGPFYLSIKTNRKPDDNVWFKVQPMGENKINDMMKSIVANSWEQRQKVYQPQRSQNGCEQIEESERRAVGDCKGHRTQDHSVIRQLRRGKWRRTATAFICHFREE